MARTCKFGTSVNPSNYRFTGKFLSKKLGGIVATGIIGLRASDC